MPNGDAGRHMGLDVGDRRIGVALSDETATLASALTTARPDGRTQGRGGGGRRWPATTRWSRSWWACPST